MLTFQEKERGQSIIVIAFIVVVLLALVAVVVDVGNAYAQRRVVQNAVDSAAMAGTMKLTEGLINGDPNGQFFGVTDELVLQAVEDYAEANGLDANNVVAWYIDAGGQRLRQVGTTPGSLVPRQLYDANGVLQDVEGVEVKGDLPFNTYFAHLIGFPTMTATAPAQAWVLKGPCTGENLFPIALDMLTFEGEEDGLPQVGTTYTMWDQELNAPGNFGWINWEGEGSCDPGDTCQGTSEQCLDDNMHWTIRSGLWNCDDWVPGTPGENAGQAIREEMACRIFGGGDGCDADNSDPVVVIPLYDNVQGSGQNASYQIEAFGAFHLVCYRHSQSHVYEANPGDCDPCEDQPSNVKCVRGYFVDYVVPSGTPGCRDTGIIFPSFRRP